MKVEIKPSALKTKKYTAIFYDDKNKKIKTTHFGNKGSSDYTINKNDKTKHSFTSAACFSTFYNNISNKKLRESLDKYIEGLSDTRLAELEGNKGAIKQTVLLKSLRSQIEDVSNTQALRLDGIKRLRSEFDPYFKDVTNEQLLNGQASKSYDILTNSILKRAKATAATNILVKNAEKEFELNEKLKDLDKDKEETQKRLNKLNETNRSTTLEIGDAGSIGNKNLNDAVKAEKKINKLLEDRKVITDELSKVSGTNLELEAIVKANEVIIPEDSKDIETNLKIKDVKNYLSQNKPIILFLNYKDYIKKNNLKLLNFHVSLELPIEVLSFKEITNILITKYSFFEKSKIVIKDYEIDSNERSITKQNVKVKLTEKELELILKLSSSNGLNKSYLLKSIWKHSLDLDTHAFETHLHRLRKKINKYFKDKNFIIERNSLYYLSD